MNKEKLNERFLKFIFFDNGLLIDVNFDVNNDDSHWKTILSLKDRIHRIETSEWKWNFQTGEVVVFQ